MSVSALWISNSSTGFCLSAARHLGGTQQERKLIQPNVNLKRYSPHSENASVCKLLFTGARDKENLDPGGVSYRKQLSRALNQKKDPCLLCRVQHARLSHIYFFVSSLKLLFLQSRICL